MYNMHQHTLARASIPLETPSIDQENEPLCAHRGAAYAARTGAPRAPARRPRGHTRRLTKRRGCASRFRPNGQNGRASPAAAAGAYLNDLHMFDARTLTWHDLTAAAGGTVPTEREECLFAAVGDRLYLFGGVQSTGP